MSNVLDVLFIAAPSSNPSIVEGLKYQGMPPLGIGYLATSLKQVGYSVDIIDMALSNNTINSVLFVLKNRPTRMVGFSCTTETFNNAVRMAKIIKKVHKNIIIVFGGPHVSFEYEQALLGNDEIDYIIINEGESSLKKLCDYCIRNTGSIDEVRGIAFRKNGAIFCTASEPFIEDLDSLPFPDRTLFPDLNQYAFPATISTSRGCPGKCVFCAASVLSGGRYRMRSAKSIVDEFEYLKSLGFSHVLIIDDTLTASMKRLNDFLDELISRKLNMTWYCESRIDIITREMLVKMKAAGLTQIQFGVESGSQKILDSIKKGIKLDKIRKVFIWCREMNIKTMTNMIIGQPEDTTKTIESTVMLAEELVKLGAQMSFTICTPFPGTPLWKNAEEFGIKMVDDNLDHYSTFHPVIETKYLSTADIRNEYYRAVRHIHKIMLENMKKKSKKCIF